MPVHHSLWSVTLALLVALSAIPVWAQENVDAVVPPGFESIFNGRDLSGWTGAVSDYHVEEGCIVCKPGKGGVLFTKQQYADFVLKIEFQIPTGGNNGLAIRYPGHGRASYDAMCELQILDDESPKYASLDSRQYHGSIYGIVAAKRGSLKPAGQWNQQEVMVQGSRIRVVLNGNVIVDADVADVNDYLDNKPHPGKMLTQGHFGFAGHSDPVKFRNIFIKQLKPAVTPAPNPLRDALRSKLTFLATFDNGHDADWSLAEDRSIYTAVDLGRKTVEPGLNIPSISLEPRSGRYGGAMRFSEKTERSPFYSAKSIGYQPENWSGTASFWMQLDPDRDLQPGYCDPLMITDKQWNDSAFFIDFDKDLPRAMRLGVFPDFKSWNPNNTPWEKIAVAERPMVVVNQPPFAANQWTHVCFTWDGANQSEGQSGSTRLYLNGQLQGTNSQELRFTWNPEQAVIQFGIYYIGRIDEIAFFNTALSADEVAQLYQLPDGLRSWIADR